jgi:hypothetical protein
MPTITDRTATLNAALEQVREGRTVTLADAEATLSLCGAVLPLLPCLDASEVRQTSEVLRGIVSRAAARRGVRGMDAPMLRGCMVDLSVILTGFTR